MEQNFEKTFEVFKVINNLLFRACEEFIIETLTSLKDMKWTFLDNECCVTYDGGAHPEYDATPNALVESIYIDKNGKICLDLDECYGYPMDRVSAEEVYYIAAALNHEVVFED